MKKCGKDLKMVKCNKPVFHILCYHFNFSYNLSIFVVVCVKNVYKVVIHFYFSFKYIRQPDEIK